MPSTFEKSYLVLTDKQKKFLDARKSDTNFQLQHWSIRYEDDLTEIISPSNFIIMLNASYDKHLEVHLPSDKIGIENFKRVLDKEIKKEKKKLKLLY